MEDAPTRSDDLRWFDLFHRRCTRRDFLRAGGSAAALIAFGGTLPGRRGDRAPRFAADPFPLGVASGDPTREGVVLWTRLLDQTIAAGGDPAARVPVRWEVAEDDGFRKIVKKGDVLALPELGLSVHAEVEGLRAGRDYWYRFVAGGVASAVGHTRTAPRSTERVRFAFASCQDVEDGYFTAYRHMAEEDLDFVVHLGDYIYEVGSRPNTVRPHGLAEAVTLEDYRSRYKLYRSDPDLQAGHAALPFVVTWDDHDVDNNYASGMPERDQDPAPFVLRRAAAYQAYYEFLPLRRASMPRGPDMGLFRRLDFGSLLSMSLLDTRQFRDDQACGDRIKPSCAPREESARSMLGAGQEGWLEQGWKGSRTRWNVLAQGVVMAPLQYVQGGVPAYSMDSWDGYPAARQRILEAFASGAVANPVVLSGDIHSNWVMDLHARPEDPDSPVVATELVGTSITSGGDGREVEEESPGMNARNPHVRFYNERRGYVSCDVTEERLTARFRNTPVVSEPGRSVATAATFVVESGRPGAIRDGSTPRASRPAGPPPRAG